MKCKKYLKLCLVVFIIILIIATLFAGIIIGFPWERAKAVNKVKEYVETKYGLTTTDVRVIFSVDGMSAAYVSTEELPFKFDVLIVRKNLKVVGDLYLEELVEYKLEQFIKEDVESLLEDSDIRVVLESRFSKSNPELTIEEVNSNPNIIFSIPDITYFCSVDVIEIGSERSFLIFKQITEHFNPTSIYFHYVDTDNKENSVCIKKSDFDRIHNMEDLLSVIK